MKNKWNRWLQKMAWRTQAFMAGRYGYDELSRFLSIAALLFIIVGLFCYPTLFLILSLVAYGFAFFRMYSKSIAKRRKELDAYYRMAGPVKAWGSRQKRKWSERKTHRYFTCKTCRTSLRVPKGKGKLKIHCPKCGTEVIKKT